jgi:uncharacterized protein
VAGLADSKARDVAARSKEMALAFELPYVLTVSKPVQPGKGHRAGAGGLSSYAAAAEKGVPSILAEAGGVGQMQEDAVALLVQGVINVMRHLGMIDDAKSHTSNSETHSKPKPKKTAHSAVATTVLTTFDWLYTKHEGMWYPKVAPGDLVKKGQETGTVGDLFGDTLEKIISPVNGVILFLTINPSVLENGLLMGIGARK